MNAKRELFMCMGGARCKGDFQNVIDAHTEYFACDDERSLVLQN